MPQWEALQGKDILQIWSDFVQISKSYDRCKFAFVILKGTLILSYVIISMKLGLFSCNFIKENEPNLVNRKEDDEENKEKKTC